MSKKHNVPSKAGRREWLGLAVLALPTMLLSLDVTVLHFALPHLAADLEPNSTQQLWILDIYAFMLAGFLITMGTLGDRIGRRRLLMIGAFAFGVSSVVAAYSQSAEMLIVARALLGISGATLLPSTLSLIRNMFLDTRQRATAISVWVMCFSVGGILGPIVGGVLLEFFWWGSVFLLGVPIMVLLLITAPFLLPEYRAPHTSQLDWSSVLLSLTAILLVVFGLKEFTKDGFHTLPIVAFVIGIVVVWAFVRRQYKLKEPFLDVTLFRRTTFSSSFTLMLINMMIYGAFILFFTQYLQMVKGLSPLHAAFLMLPCSAGSIIGTLAAPILARKFRPAYVISFGLIISSVSLFLFSQIEVASGMSVLITGSFFLTLGMGPLQTLATDLIIGSAPSEKAGSASSLSETSGELGMALGIAILGSIGTVVYRHNVELPSGVQGDLGEAIRDTLARAVATVGQLPEMLGAEVIELARSAFVAGFNTVSVISAITYLLLAFVSMFFLKHVRPIGESDSDQSVKGAENEQNVSA